LVAFFFYK
jgi:uncharacterized membrane protein YgcG